MNLRSTDSMSVEALQSKGCSFKNTEVGRVPTDWEVVCLREVANFGGGTTPPRKNFEKFYASGTHPWVKTLDLNNGYISSTEENVTEAAFSETSLKMHPIGTVLVAMYGGFNQIGRTGLIQVGAAINQALVAVITKKERLAPTYLINYLNYKVDYWKTVASSSRKDPNITSNDVKNFMLPLPSVIEQTAIANALSDVDALIQELEKLIAKKQAIKTATMQQLLTGRTRLPQFAHHPDGRKKGNKPSELGEIPEDWGVYSLSSICDVRDGTHDSPKYRDNGIPLVTSKNIVNDVLDLTEVSLISLEDASEINKRSKVDKGDIIMSMIGTVGSAVLLRQEPEFCIKNVALFKPRGVLGEFLVQLIRSKLFQDYLVNSMDGGIQKFVSLGTLRNMQIALPTKEEQSILAEFMCDMDEEIQALEQRLFKTRQIKQGMMQELLTGKTRLVKPAGAA